MKNSIESHDSKRQGKLAAFDRLLTIMDELRANCPWDKKQTTESLRHLTIEEVFELSDAILENNMDEVKKELGDIILHMVFYSKIADEKNAFDIQDVLTSICDKLIYRHPHIYGDPEHAGAITTAEDEEVVKQNWERIKLKEKGNRSVLGGVPNSLPALIKAMRIQEKARGVGFDWDNKGQVWEKVKEEMEEFHHEIEADKDIDPLKVQGEFGDLLFSLINYARFVGINPEEALERTNKKFIKRFQYMETESAKAGKNIAEMTLEEMEAYWEKAKNLQ